MHTPLCNGTDNYNRKNNEQSGRRNSPRKTDAFDWYKFYNFTSMDYHNLSYDYFDELTFKGEYHKLADRVQPLLIVQSKERTVRTYHNLYATETHVVGMFGGERHFPLQALAGDFF